jgi:hypothetical protein
MQWKVSIVFVCTALLLLELTRNPSWNSSCATWNRVVLQKPPVIQLVKKIPEESLPCSQNPVTGPYPEPDESNLHFPTLSH